MRLATLSTVFFLNFQRYKIMLQAAIDYGVLKSLPSFIGIDSSSDSILKDCFLIISNILGGTREQIQVIHIIVYLVYLIKHWNRVTCWTSN